MQCSAEFSAIAGRPERNTHRVRSSSLIHGERFTWHHSQSLAQDVRDKIPSIPMARQW